MRNIRKLLPVLASGLLAGLTLAMAARMPQPSASDLEALAAMNTVQTERAGDHQAFMRNWMFGTATTTRGPKSSSVPVE